MSRFANLQAEMIPCRDKSGDDDEDRDLCELKLYYLAKL